MMEFGEKLRLLRKQRNLTQQQLASLIGVKNSVISFYEVGDRMPSPEMILKLASTFHVSTDYLLGIDKGEQIDVSGLSEKDIMLIRELVESLRAKNI